MTALRLHDTLTRTVRALEPVDGVLRMYTCGPTVYRDVHLGNLRSYLMADWIGRVAEASGLAVRLVKNITDVGHMRQDALDRGEDKVIAAALAAGRTPAEIASLYESRFHDDERRLNIRPATVFPRATGHVARMVELTETLVRKGHAYAVEGNVYYAVRSFAPYGRLSGNLGEALRQGVRGDVDLLKRDPADFALWKRGEPGRALVWPSPWGDGFPGWHIECSAMGLEHLGERIDLHTGGVDNIFPHHEGEIAQSEAALGHPVVTHWAHGQHLLAGGVKMAKSARNTVTVDELTRLGFDPLAFRYQALLTHYRARMHFSLGALHQAAAGLAHLRERVHRWSRTGTERDRAIEERAGSAFQALARDDLDLPGALALLWRIAKDERVPARSRLEVALGADRILGLDLEHAAAAAIPRERVARRPWPLIASPREVRDRRADVASRSWTVALVVREHPADVARAVTSVLAHLPADGEVLILDQSSGEEAALAIHRLADLDPRVGTLFADRDLGEGAGRNALLRATRGARVLQLDASVELTGDLFAALEAALRPTDVAIAGPWGLRTDDLKDFHEVTAGEVDAVQGYCLAARRDTLLALGGFDERFRFYRNLDVALSMTARERGLTLVAAGVDVVARHTHRAWEELPAEEREKRSRRNFDRMYRRFHDAPVLVGGRVPHAH